MNRLIEATFKNRGYTQAYLCDIEDARRDILLDSDRLCGVLKEIHDTGKKLVVLPDFDMDGIMSGVTGFAGFAELGFNVGLFIPDPKDGYGFTPHTIGRLLADHPDVDTIITCDVGISCHDGVKAAQMAGLRVLVTDHHTQTGPSFADCVVNPMRLDETYSHPAICGAHVLYQCLEHYAMMYCDRFTQEQIIRLRVFAGIGTVSDSMPLLYENRELVRNAVSILRMLYDSGSDFIVNSVSGCDIYRRAFRGLYNILTEFSELKKLTGPKDISEEFIGFYLAPTFNSIKRMDGDMRRAFDVFFGADPISSVKYLVNLNDQRKIAVSDFHERLFEIDQPYAPYVYLSDARPGILGLLAQKLTSESGMPVMVVANVSGTSKMHGSGRAPDWYPFLDRTCPAGFWAAGHNPAFGVHFADTLEIKSMIAFLERDVAFIRSGMDASCFAFTPDFTIALDDSGDTSIDILLFMEYLHDLEQYRPFGSRFPRPEALLKFSADQGEWSVMGREKQHLKIRLPYGFDVLLWNQAEKFDLKDTTKELQIIGRLGNTTFNNQHSINFVGDKMINLV